MTTALHLTSRPHGHARGRLLAAARPDLVVVSDQPAPADWPSRWYQRGTDESLAAALEATRATRLVVDEDLDLVSHDLPTTLIARPGRWNDDDAVSRHVAASTVVGCWPPHVGHDAWEAPGALSAHFVGGLSGFDDRPVTTRGERGMVVVLLPRVGRRPSLSAVVRLGQVRPDLRIRVIGRVHGQVGRVDDQVTVVGQRVDVWAELQRAEIVVTSGNLDLVNDVAAARRPLLVLPSAVHPRDDEGHLGRALAAHALAIVGPPDPDGDDLADLVEDTRGFGQFWDEWHDRRAAVRLVSLL